MKVGNVYGLVSLLVLVPRPFRKRNSLQDHLVLDIFSKIVWSFSCTSISRFISITFIPWMIRPILSYMNVISNWASIGVFEPCALNAEIQRFVLSFSISYWDLIKFPYFADGCHSKKRGVKGVKGSPKTGWRQGDFRNISNVCWFLYSWWNSPKKAVNSRLHCHNTLLLLFCLGLNLDWITWNNWRHFVKKLHWQNTVTIFEPFETIFHFGIIFQKAYMFLATNRNRREFYWWLVFKSLWIGLHPTNCVLGVGTQFT
jgi:hypothetical protein